MINYILTKYYYYKYIWTIRKSIGSLGAIKDIETKQASLLGKQRTASFELERSRLKVDPNPMKTATDINGNLFQFSSRNLPKKDS